MTAPDHDLPAAVPPTVPGTAGPCSPQGPATSPAAPLPAAASSGPPSASSGGPEDPTCFVHRGVTVRRTRHGYWVCEVDGDHRGTEFYVADAVWFANRIADEEGTDDVA